MRIALCQIDPTVGDIDGNVALVVAAARRARDEGAELAVLPELAIVGYPPRDLLERERFVTDGLAGLERCAAEVPHELAVLVGFVGHAPAGASRRVHNSVALLRGGVVERVAHKRLLPTYDVFDEDRWFEPGDASVVVDVAGVKLGLTICEDIWNDVDVMASRRYAVNPVEACIAQGAEVIVNVAASPFTLPKRAGRAAMLSEVARRHARPVVFVNQVGGNDDLLFDGSSAIWGPDGALWARAAEHADDFLVCELAPGGPIREQAPTLEASALDALALGTRDYARKCGFTTAVLGLSGGIDSALTACVAASALGAENVLGVAMPTRYSSPGSLTDAEALARALGIGYRVVPIDGLFEAYLTGLAPHLDVLGPPGPSDVTWENVQSRIRCATLMAISNRCGHLLLTTGNKSEIAVGYCTLYGDMAGGLAVISDLPKTFVYRVSAEVNRRGGRAIIPESTMTKAPSAELRPNQTDQDSLPPYDLLDAILERHVEDGKSADEIIAEGRDEATVRRVVRMVRTSEYKRRQMAPGLILTRKAFGPGRRYPIAQRYPR